MMETPLVPQNFFKPSELLNIFRNRLSKQDINMTLICLQGIYWKSDRLYAGKGYDTLKDENSSEEITVVTPQSLRDNLTNGNLVTVHGTIDGRLQQNGSIRIQVNVSRVDKVKDIAISEDEMKRAEFRRIKTERGFKNVDNLLESKLLAGERPKVSLIYAGATITDADFDKGIASAKASIDFVDYRANFMDPPTACALLAKLDADDSDVIALVRGGGSDLARLDDIKIVEALTYLSKAWICSVGHEKDKLFIRNIADKVISVPFALATYFRDMVETVTEKRSKSRAVLVQEVKKQYEKQLDEANKRNEMLTKQLEALRQSSAKMSEEVSKQTKAMEEMQAQLEKAKNSGCAKPGCGSLLVLIIALITACCLL